MARRRLGLSALALTLALAVAACGGGAGEPGPTATPEPTPSPQPTPTAPPAAGPDVEPVEPTNVIDLASETPLLTILSAGPDDFQTGGVSVARGDFNGDGVEDLLIGAPFADGPDGSRRDAGEAYVLFGPLGDGPEIDLALDAADVTIYGARPEDNLGFTVAAGDLNDDGTDDIIVAAPASHGLRNIRTDLGEVYVIFGSPSLPATVDTMRVEQDFTFRSAEGFTRAGSSLAVGDVNDDGIADLVIGGPFGGREEGTPAGSPRTSEGEVYVVFGSPELGGEVDVARGEEDARFKGAREFENFGQAVAVGDVNGDGIGDIIVTARRAAGPDGTRRDAGGAFVFFGSPELAGFTPSSQADVTIHGAEAGDLMGDVVAAGDLDGDGLTDIVLSARFAKGPESLRPVGGEAYVLFAASLTGVVDLADTAPDVIIYGRDGADSMPSALALSGLTGNGSARLALGAAAADGPSNTRPGAGEVYVLAGDSLGEQIDLRVDVEGVTFIYGAQSGDLLGTALLWLDMNGDGREELLLLAPGPPGAVDGRGRLFAIEIPSP